MIKKEFELGGSPKLWVELENEIWCRLTCEIPAPGRLLLGYDSPFNLAKMFQRMINLSEGIEAFTPDTEGLIHICGLSTPFRAYSVVAATLSSSATHIGIEWEKGSDGSSAISQTVSLDDLKAWVEFFNEMSRNRTKNKRLSSAD